MTFHGDGGFAGTSNIAGKSKRRPAKETPVSFYGEAPGTNLQQADLQLRDRLLILQTQQAEAALADRQRQFLRQLAAAIENEVRNRMNAMDNEMEAAKKLNWALEARVQSLTVENHLWRELAQSNEAAANLLRADLEQAITTHICINEERQLQCNCYEAVADDGESCCGDSEDSNKMAAPPPPSPAARICRSCRRNEPTVLLLPCRHLCLCAACGSTANSCPICNCFTSGTVHVNLS
ncbi:hypothetical protein KSP39_PZI000342 [Platanthera zijinensis]|uniref:RING-type domain-containing protein n=1 Tax=Platanthera zijinensis TaxID=2320716 RepID=A0AAP0C5A8_9ASPA